MVLLALRWYAAGRCLLLKSAAGIALVHRWSLHSLNRAAGIALVHCWPLLHSDGAAGIALVRSWSLPSFKWCCWYCIGTSLVIAFIHMVVLVLHWYIADHSLLLDGAVSIALVQSGPLYFFIGGAAGFHWYTAGHCLLLNGASCIALVLCWSLFLPDGAAGSALVFRLPLSYFTRCCWYCIGTPLATAFCQLGLLQAVAPIALRLGCLLALCLSHSLSSIAAGRRGSWLSDGIRIRADICGLDCGPRAPVTRSLLACFTRDLYRWEGTSSGIPCPATHVQLHLSYFDKRSGV